MILNANDSFYSERLPVGAEDGLAEKQQVRLPALLVASGIHNKVQAVLHPVEGRYKV
jgi:hypothetical protein